ncbi:MAG: hypothetical protein V4615_02630 [Bacteroidota bacterium]
MKKFFLLSTLACSLLCVVSSCKYNEEYQVINAKNEFSISVPSWMKEEETLAPGAPFQYANRFRNFYAIGLISKKDTATAEFNYYWNNNLTALKKSLTKPLVTDSIPVEINGVKGMRAEILGKLEGENIFFSEVLLDGKAKYYHLSVWVRGDERKLRFKEDINKILGSFKEL